MPGICCILIFALSAHAMAYNDFVDHYCSDASNNLALCKLREVLGQASAEVNFIIRSYAEMKEINPSENGIKSNNHFENEFNNNAENRNKRKSAFVRFGKRASMDDSGSDRGGVSSMNLSLLSRYVDKRKSSYVRFGKRKNAINIQPLSM